jgi:8-oxo-dGTP pyrophosphatase MutT (NUDIX family)
MMKNKMRYIKSCGFVAYKTLENVNYYLIIRSINGDVGFPKGHMEIGESEIEAAIRELKEETNIEVNIAKGFRRQIEYPLPGRADAIKQSVYFLGECITDNIICQEGEIADAAFLPFSEALSALTFDDTKRILEDAEEFLLFQSK